MKQITSQQKKKLKRILFPILRLLLFLVTLLSVIVRILTLVPIIVGILIIWKDKTRHGRFLGWLLVIGGLFACVLYTVVYSVEGGLVY